MYEKNFIHITGMRAIIGAFPVLLYYMYSKNFPEFFYLLKIFFISFSKAFAVILCPSAVK